jgi:CheY-like chemotaxis protein
MADLNLERLSILVVEDNNYMRSMLTMALKALGVGTVKTAAHGGEAIDVLRLMAIDPMKAGVMAIDAIFSNWQMSPVDGMMLLRWVRRHKESPNRFIPFVMVSGYADRPRVAEARDLGVSEFMAKPYSVDMVAQRLLQVIEKPRQFVHTSDYFGPDRRRHQSVFADRDRRRLSDDSPEVEIVYD